MWLSEMRQLQKTVKDLSSVRRPFWDAHLINWSPFILKLRRDFLSLLWKGWSVGSLFGWWNMLSKSWANWCPVPFTGTSQMIWNLQIFGTGSLACFLPNRGEQLVGLNISWPFIRWGYGCPGCHAEVTPTDVQAVIPSHPPSAENLSLVKYACTVRVRSQSLQQLLVNHIHFLSKMGCWVGDDFIYSQFKQETEGSVTTNIFFLLEGQWPSHSGGINFQDLATAELCNLTAFPNAQQPFLFSGGNLSRCHPSFGLWCWVPSSRINRSINSLLLTDLGL